LISTFLYFKNIPAYCWYFKFAKFSTSNKWYVYV